MKTKKKYLIIVMLLAMLILIIKPSTAQAALQSNGGTVKKDKITNWMLNIRDMESIGNTLGLTDTIDSTALLSSKESNNLDIHMEKNTEYGAMAILSASSYGNPNVIANGETTTGNKTGIVINLNREWVAGGGLTGLARFVNANNRYKNVYALNYSAKVGDAISETAGWHGGGNNKWLDKIGCGIERAHSVSIFSYYGWQNTSNHYNTNADELWATRAVIVVGTGV